MIRFFLENNTAENYAPVEVYEDNRNGGDFFLLSMSEGGAVATYISAQPHTGVTRNTTTGIGIKPTITQIAQPKTITYTVLCKPRYDSVGNMNGTREKMRQLSRFLASGDISVIHGNWGGACVGGYLADTPQVSFLNKLETEAKITFTLTFTMPFLTNPVTGTSHVITQLTLEDVALHTSVSRNTYTFNTVPQALTYLAVVNDTSNTHTLTNNKLVNVSVTGTTGGIETTYYSSFPVITGDNIIEPTSVYTYAGVYLLQHENIEYARRLKVTGREYSLANSAGSPLFPPCDSIRVSFNGTSAALPSGVRPVLVTCVS